MFKKIHQQAELNAKNRLRVIVLALARIKTFPLCLANIFTLAWGRPGPGAQTLGHMFSFLYMDIFYIWTNKKYYFFSHKILSHI